MSQYPSYSYPSAPANPPVQQHHQPQRSARPIVVGGGGGGANATTNAPRMNAAAAVPPSSSVVANINNNNNGSGRVVHKSPPECRYVGDALSILRSYRADSRGSGGEEGKKKRSRADCAEELSRLVPPLSRCARRTRGRRSATGDCANDATGGDDGDFGGGGAGESASNEWNGGTAVEGAATAGGDERSSAVQHADRRCDHLTRRQRQLREEFRRYKRQNELLNERRACVFKSMVALHELYETGLDGISRMNDLRFVPDNVMPNDVPR